MQDRGLQSRVASFRCPALIPFANTSGVVRGVRLSARVVPRQLLPRHLDVYAWAVQGSLVRSYGGYTLVTLPRAVTP